jgi:hypothetical protein
MAGRGSDRCRSDKSAGSRTRGRGGADEGGHAGHNAAGAAPARRQPVERNGQVRESRRGTCDTDRVATADSNPA